VTDAHAWGVQPARLLTRHVLAVAAAPLAAQMRKLAVPSESRQGSFLELGDSTQVSWGAKLTDTRILTAAAAIATLRQLD
jgi:ABC-type dipeptide/oligopeptide/nickel transport system permease subunit